MELQLPLNLEAWSSMALPKTRYHQPATNFNGRRVLRTPLLDAEINASKPKKTTDRPPIMRSLPVEARFRAM